MSHRQKILLLLFTLLIYTAVEAADFKPELVEAPLQQPGAHKFWNRTNLVLLGSHAGLEALDFGITHHNISHGGVEVDPMAKALCESGTSGQIVFFGGRTAGVVGISYLLHRLRQHKMERTFILYASGDSLYGVTYSFVHR